MITEWSPDPAPPQTRHGLLRCLIWTQEGPLCFLRIKLKGHLHVVYVGCWLEGLCLGLTPARASGMCAGKAAMRLYSSSSPSARLPFSKLCIVSLKIRLLYKLNLIKGRLLKHARLLLIISHISFAHVSRSRSHEQVTRRESENTFH